MIIKTIKNIKIKLFCNKDKHDWEYCTWGNALVDNLDGTFSFAWSIPTRHCKNCGEEQLKLKSDSDWKTLENNLTINDMQ